jgi:uncharacterized protein involved in response to NO
MSPRERTAWIAVACTIVVWGYYFAAFWMDVAARQLDGQQILIRFVACMVVSLVVMIGLNVATGVMTRRNIETPPDEMERQIEGRADRIGFRVLEALVPLALIAGLLSAGRIAEAFPADPGGSTALIFANGVLAVIVFTELVRELTHIVGFRSAA